MQIPTFSLPNIDGGEISMESFPEAKGFIVVFTCNHCPYAIAYESRIIELDKKFRAQGFPVIAISSNDVAKYPQDSPENMKLRAETKGFTFPYLFDESQEIAKAFEAERTPHVYIIQNSEAGPEIVYKGAIDDNYQRPAEVKQKYVEEVVEKLIRGENVEYFETPAVGCSIKWK